MSDQFSSSFRGALDLSSLRQPPNKDTDLPSAEAAAPTVVKVASLVSELTEVNLRHYLELSSKLVVLVDFFSTADESSVALSQKLESIVPSFGGKVILCRLEIEKQQRVVEAFAVNQPATLLAMMAGQPVPLFAGDQDLDKIQAVIEKL
ncbi:MAG: hypothetical protein K9G66_04590, partial [Rhodoluna sp.]|nr:hypothetical protein [Rhodoluna sp.]